MWRNYERNRRWADKAMSMPVMVVSVVMTAQRKEFHKGDVAAVTASRCRYCRSEAEFRPYDVMNLEFSPESQFSEAASRYSGLTNEQLKNEAGIMDRLPVIRDYLESSSSLLAVYSRQCFEMFQGIVQLIYRGSIKDCMNICEMVKDQTCMMPDVQKHDLLTISDLYGVTPPAPQGPLGAAVQNRLTIQVMNEVIQEVLAYDPQTELRKDKISVQSIGYYQGYRGQSRIYVNTETGKLWYNVLYDSWQSDDIDLNRVNMVDIEQQVLSLAGCSSSAELRQYRPGNRMIA